MTTAALRPHQTTIPHWQQEMADAFTRLDDLLAFLDLEASRLPLSPAAGQGFPLRVPRPFAARMAKGDPHDPLLRQVLPVSAELHEHPAFGPDPVGDIAAVAAGGVLHKYHGRALLIATGTCAVNCRYCFRREFPYGEHGLSRSRQAAAMAYLREDVGLAEVILSGGDPLLLSDGRLNELIVELAGLNHLQRLRVHTRLPVVLPSRISPGLVEALSRTRLATVVVIHANHASEIDASVATALDALRRAGVTLLNQSVLLQGVNDEAETLIRLSERLFEAGVLPYYLHLLDRTRGTVHFEVDPTKALALLTEMRRRLPGYLVPRMVREREGAPFKIPIEAL